MYGHVMSLVSVWCHCMMSCCLEPCSFQGVSVQGSLCPGESLSRVLCPGFSVQGISVRGLCPGGLCLGVCPWGSLSLDRCQGDPPDRDSPDRDPPCTVKSGRYTSYWNAFLFGRLFSSWILISTGLPDVDQDLTRPFFPPSKCFPHVDQSESNLHKLTQFSPAIMMHRYFC